MDKYLVCNADESEPGTFKDRELMQKNPHLLIEGMIIAAYAAGANRAFIYIRGEYEQQADILDAALAEAYEAGLPRREHPRLGLRLSSSCTAAPAPTSAARRPALLDSLEGKRGNPRLKPPFPANQGLYQGPTLINNVETLATVPHIIEMGGEEYAKIGVENSTGTKLVSVSGNVQRPGNYEIELGMSSREIIYGLAGGPPEGREVKLWFPGGSSLAGADRRTTSTSPTTSTRWPRPARCSAPARSSSSTTRISVVDVALKLAEFYRHESCGKCTPCREGTNWTVKMLERIEDGAGHADGPRHHGLGPGAASSATACACSATRWRCRSAR